MGMVLELLTEVGEGEEFEAWVGEGKAVLSEATSWGRSSMM
jgi:uncharacterized protein YidB (DUF937 family)